MTAPTFEVISLGPSADGWRAVFSGENGTVTAPLVFWAAYRKKAPGQPDETLISGVCADSSPGGPVRFLIPAAAAASFEGYFPPGHPDPPRT